MRLFSSKWLVMGIGCVVLVLLGQRVTNAVGPVWNGARGRVAMHAPSAASPTALPALPNVLLLGPGDFFGSSSQDMIVRPNAALVEPDPTFAGVDVVAPVHLPRGARISQITLLYRDTDPISRPSAGLWQSRMGVLTLVAPLDAVLPPVSFADGDDVRSLPVDAPPVDGASSYAVLVTLNRDLSSPTHLQQLYAVRIDYAFTVVLPTLRQ